MQRITVTNAKGGCGKSTLATSLAAFLAGDGHAISLFDYDPQGSSLNWLRLRSGQWPKIHGVAAHRTAGNGVTRAFQLRVPHATDYVVKDTPAGMSGMDLVHMVQASDVLLIPVLPSPIDIHAVTNFIRDLLVVGKARSHSVRIGVVANRVRQNTLMYQALRKFLHTLNITFVAALRDTQNYAKSAQQGVGIGELQLASAARDVEQWQALLHWLHQAPEPRTEAATRINPAPMPARPAGPGARVARQAVGDATTAWPRNRLTTS